MNIINKEYNEWITFCEKLLKEKSIKEQRNFFIRAYVREHLKVERASEFIHNKNYWNNILELNRILEGDV